MTPRQVLSGAVAASVPMSPPIVLLVDDDPGTIDSIGALLRHMGVHVHTAGTRMAAIELGRAQRLDLALVDWRLPDGTGFDVVRVWHHERLFIPWILMSGFLDFDLAAEAGRLGALRAVQCCFDVEEVVTRAFIETRRERGRGWPTLPLKPRLPEPQSSAERWAHHVLRACDAGHDLRTVPDWAAFVGMSGSTLEAICLTIRFNPARPATSCACCEC